MSALPRLAYLTALYPAMSHTFIQREVAALRELGFEVHTCSMRQPDATHLTGREEREAHASTFYAIDTGKKPAAMLAALGSAITRPGKFLRALALAARTAPPGLRGGLKQAAYFAESLVLARHLRGLRVDHLHNHFADPSANVAMLTSALTDIPFSYTLHGPAELYEPEKWQLRTKTARATFVACISNFCRSQAMYFSDPDHWHKLRIIHCGVLPERYGTAAKDEAPDAGIDTGKYGSNLVFVGRLTAIKGLRVLLAAFARARQSAPELKLTLVGDGDDRSTLEELAAPLGGSVHFAGYQDQEGVAAALAAADALVLPSFAEGLPVVLMEALAAGKPVICTQVAGVGELVENGVSGFLVPAGDEDSLCKAILRLVAEPAQQSAMGAAGRDLVHKEFDARKEAARIGALFCGRAGTSVRPEPLQPTKEIR